jgi:hypothetical protein
LLEGLSAESTGSGVVSDGMEVASASLKGRVCSTPYAVYRGKHAALQSQSG